MLQVELRSARSTRLVKPAPAARAVTPRTTSALAGLGVTLVVFFVAVGPRLIGPMTSAPASAAQSAEADRDLEILRALPLDRLRQEQKKRAAAVNRLVNTTAPPRDQLGAARDAAYRVSIVLAETAPRDR